MEKTQENILGTKSIGRLLFNMSFPAIAAQIVNVLYNMVDRMYIGHIPDIGADALIGVGVTMIALGNAKTSVFLALLRKVFLLIPLIFILPQFMENKVNSVFLAEPIADIIAVLVTGIVFAIQFKKVLRELSTDL